MPQAQRQRQLLVGVLLVVVGAWVLADLCRCDCGIVSLCQHQCGFKQTRWWWSVLEGVHIALYVTCFHIADIGAVLTISWQML
jgi:hypothetical protein